jgi:hypothetical protein
VDPIPQPQLLDPDRILDPQRDDMNTDHESRAQKYKDGLHESCAYAQQLWQTLDGVRAYLMESLPPDPRDPDAHVTCASPTGPDDEPGWVHWIDMFSVVTSAMCGPHGDSGFGYGQAREAAQVRRTVEAPPPPPAPVAPAEATVASNATEASDVGRSARSKPIRVVAGAVIAVLAVRGLLPRPPRRTSD